jgi:NifU-like protein involved in Fe-S cluster formation
VVTPELRQLLRQAPRAGALDERDGAFGTGCAEHAVCGDTVELDLRVVGDRVADLAWRADGCPATLAVAAVAGAALVGVATGELGPALRSALADRGGLADHERHAERIVLEALASAVRESQ